MEEINKEKQTFTKEEVENIIKQFNKQARSQCENLYKEVQNLRDQIEYKRLDYLFEIVKNSDKFSSEFVNKCINEIEGVFKEIPEEKEGEK